MLGFRPLASAPLAGTIPVRGGAGRAVVGGAFTKRPDRLGRKLSLRELQEPQVERRRKRVSRKKERETLRAAAEAAVRQAELSAAEAKSLEDLVAKLKAETVKRAAEDAIRRAQYAATQQAMLQAAHDHALAVAAHEQDMDDEDAALLVL